MRKIKPLYRLSEYETATYCFLRGLDYAMGACPFSGGASFTAHKKLLAELEHRSPGQKFAFYENFLGNARPLFQQQLQNDGGGPVECARCGYPCMSGLCGVCSIKEQVAEKIKANPGLTPWEIG